MYGLKEGMYMMVPSPHAKLHVGLRVVLGLLSFCSARVAGYLVTKHFASIIYSAEVTFMCVLTHHQSGGVEVLHKNNNLSPSCH